MRKVIIAFVSLLIGLMVAILFQSNQQPEDRDTRDLWEIRTELRDKQMDQQNLYDQIREAEQTLEQYQRQSNEEQIETLKKSVEQLKVKAGLTEIDGRGIEIAVEPIFKESLDGQAYPTIPPELLYRLMNELYTYGATDIAIEQERIIDVSPIRVVNGTTYVNNRPLPPVPIKIYVLSRDSQKLLDYMQVSKVNDYFAVENLEISYRVDYHLTLPAYNHPTDLEWIEPVDSEEAGDS
ncbi:DUF881 domain-containing protein [Salinibacillus xinjiangensis]|uniref:DUF881 domain-containing protein n=1 Tax=Salinibacillus xinjiangensis TaxID=1229268 RepID=A0A6G1X3T1_9BACI|nr:DUF881 domain-containing protein [Salinibacillus xinjiangensis]MRG85488.1 DUF881 domain-containing protein [Salinibacillus xinjiangensis]